MATTTNYSWTTPDDTGLVKDGASAIRSLGKLYPLAYVTANVPLCVKGLLATENPVGIVRPTEVRFVAAPLAL